MEKEARWPNMYGDQNPLPDLTKDMVADATMRPIKWWIKIQIKSAVILIIVNKVNVIDLLKLDINAI